MCFNVKMMLRSKRWCISCLESGVQTYFTYWNVFVKRKAKNNAILRKTDRFERGFNNKYLKNIHYVGFFEL